jgi:3D (Asp-Asp-Asp) domain-containing protein
LTYAERRNLALILLAAFIAVILLTACGTTERALPPYERPLAKTNFQNVRTTAYTHTESDHRQYSNRNALGGELRAAGPPIHRAEVVRRVTLAYQVPRAIPVDDTVETEVQRVSYSPQLQPFSRSGRRTTRAARARKERSASSARARLIPGSAAADWSRWPAGTVFRLLSTGQMYRVEDYGWALSGRNTIDLYMANRRDMNSWGAREEAIQVLQWGDPQESLEFLRSHQKYKHIKRMVLELEGHHKEAARLR